MYMQLLREGLASGQAHLEPRDGSYTPSSPQVYGLQLEEWTEPAPVKPETKRSGPADADGPSGRQGPAEASDDDGSGEDHHEEVITHRRLKRNGLRIGWCEDSRVYLLPGPSLQVVQKIAERSSLQPLPLTQRLLGAALHRIGVVSRAFGDEQHYTWKMNLGGKWVRVLVIGEGLMFPDHQWPDDDPSVKDFSRLLDS
jgi:hypothetical protein